MRFHDASVVLLKNSNECGYVSVSVLNRGSRNIKIR